MLSLLIVLTVIICILNTITYRGITQDADSILELIIKNDGEFPSPETNFVWQEDGPRYKSPELPFEVRYFSKSLISP